MKKYAISISDGHYEEWFFYKTFEDYSIGFETFKKNEDDIHGYTLNSDNEYEVINSYWVGDK